MVMGTSGAKLNYWTLEIGIEMYTWSSDLSPQREPKSVPAQEILSNQSADS